MRPLAIEHLLPSPLALGVVAWASVVVPAMADAGTIFPSDGQRLVARRVAELLQDVCPGKVEGAGCPNYCPEGATLIFVGLQVTAVYHGHFLSPTSDDAALSTGGCETSGAYGDQSATVLLTRRSQQWKMLWYKPGVITEKCHKVALRDRREILVCIDRGYWVASLNTEDLLNPNRVSDGGHVDSFFDLVDTSPCCSGGDPDVGDEVRWGSIVEVEFGKNTAEGPPPISVTANFGKEKWTAEALKKWTAEPLGMRDEALRRQEI